MHPHVPDGDAIKARLKAEAAVVEDWLRTGLRRERTPAGLLEAMEYSLLAGGKRIRPVLCLVSARLCGLGAAPVLPFACALECIHTYSLIHDDLPAMDNDDLRRGRPTNHKRFDEATALLAGDGLLTDAFVFMAQAGTGTGAEMRAGARIEAGAGAETETGGGAETEAVAGVRTEAGTGAVAGAGSGVRTEAGTGAGSGTDARSGGGEIPADRALAALRLVAEAAGSPGMVGGQYLDMQYTARPGITLEALAAMQAMKTGAMLQVACETGAVLAGAPEATRQALREYGRELGVAFQITDDILGEVGDEKTLGKPVGRDAALRKNTYPALIGLEASRKRAEAHVERAVAALHPFAGEAADLLRGLAAYTANRLS